MSGIGLGLGLGPAQGMFSGVFDVPGGVLSVATTSSGTLEITAEAGALTITVLPPSPFAGTYETTTDALALGPVNLVPPVISGAANVGEVLTATLGFWIFDASLAPPVSTIQWRSNGTAIPGETATTLTLQNAGVDVSLTETLDQPGLTAVNADSNVVVLPFPSQLVTIPTGTVGVDQTNFPVRFDLADLSPVMWQALRADGGNLRATNAADDQSYPLDIIWIDPILQRGTAFVRQDILATADADFTLRARSLSTPLAPTDDPIGRNAVWADYLSVIAFPERIDRTGQNAVFETGGFPDSYVLERVSPDIQMHQGVTWDGTHWFVVDTNQIKKFDVDWNLVQTEDDPIGLSGLSAVNHLGDPCIHNGELLIPLEVWPSGPFTNQHIAVFDPADLSFVRSHDISAAGREASAIAINPADGNLYCTDYTDGSNIPYFTPTGTYLGNLALSQTINQLQGIVFHDGKMYLSSDAGDHLYEALPDGTVTPTPVFTSMLGGSFEGITSDGSDLFVLIDSDPSSIYRLCPSDKCDLLQFETNALRVQDLPSQDVWTASVSVMPLDLPHNGAVISLVRQGGEANRATAAIRESSNPDSYNAWSNANGWMVPGATRRPEIAETVRFSYGYNGATERKLLLDGTPYAVDPGVTPRPGGGQMIWFTGAEDTNPTEHVKAVMSFAFLYDGYASDARLAAEFATLHDTSNFYNTNSG
ncbi:hypothetical protein AB3Y40_14975 [Yoonia sp. R2331]|uniref:hypothetical protein n=1 Tax=Yoonia sp. R2331 TaxID=3237238 RepID=UPI0034E48719